MTAEDQMPGRLGPYSLLGRLGEGGMGVVFLARDASGQTAAVKVLRSVVAEEPVARRRLAREVETMRRVRSPYVAEVIDADLAGDTPYIVTRYVPGRTLDQVVTEAGPLPPSALLRLASGLAGALAAVHAAGVVHRDLKPSNVMLLGELPVVIDFGIAQGPDATRLTMTGMFMGTPGFLAPEVIEGQASGEASDIHAWGATVAFAATGHPPFGSGSYEAIFYRIVNGQPDLTGAPSSLLPLLKAALARDPALRPAAVQLSAQAAALDPRGWGRDAVPGADAPGSTITAVPATSADQAPGISPAASWGAGPAAAAGLAPGPADPAAPPAGSNGAAAAGPATVRPEPAPLMAGPWPADYADVLPPVQYGPGPARPAKQPKPGPPPGPGPQARRGPGQPRSNPFAPSPVAIGAPKSRWPSAMVAVTMLAAVGISVILPVVGALGSLAFIVLLRAGELVRQRAVLRRSARGTRRSDPAVLAALSPWYLVRSLMSCLLLAPFALVAAVVAGGVAIALSPGHHLPRAVAAGAGAIVAFYGLGPGSARPRRQLHQLYAAMATTRAAQAVALAGMTALALATLAAAFSWPSLYWPAGAPGGVWHFGMAHVGPMVHLGPVRHLSLVGRFLLSRLAGR
jgi:Protein kinase domain